MFSTFIQMDYFNKILLNTLYLYLSIYVSINGKRYQVEFYVFYTFYIGKLFTYCEIKKNDSTTQFVSK